MNIRTPLLLVFALIMAGTTAFLARGWLDAQRAALLAAMQQQAQVEVEEEETATYILVAVNPMPTGHFVLPDDLAWQAWPEETAVDTYVRKGQGSVEDFVGAVVRTPMTIGEPITEARVVRPGDRGFLAAVLERGLRAVTVKVDATSGVAGFVFPGDRVDIILTHKIKIVGIHPTKKDKAVTRTASETVMHDVRVLAIDQSTYSEDGQAGVAKTATIEVNAKQAEMVRLVSAMGSLSLSLRSLAIDGPADTDKEKDGDHMAGDRDAKPAAFARRSDADFAKGENKQGENEEGYAFDDSLPNYLGRFIRRDGRTHTWDAEVSQLLDPPVLVQGTNFRMLVTRGRNARILEFSTGSNPYEFLLNEKKKEKNGFEKFFKDLFKKRDELAALDQ